MTHYYNRSNVVSFYELSDKQQEAMLDYNGESATDDSYALINEKQGESALPLSAFIRTNNNKFTHGMYGLSAFSCYTITLSKCATQCVVAYKSF